MSKLERLAPDREPWERQPKEPETGYAAFLRLRDHPLPRPSTADLYDQLEIPQKWDTFERWAGKFCWTERLAAWDAHVAKPVQDAIVATHVNAAKVVAELAIEHARGFHQLGRQELEKLIKLSADSEVPVLTPKTLMQVIKFGLELDRVLVGEYDASGDADDLDLSDLDNDDLLALQMIARKVGK